MLEQCYVKCFPDLNHQLQSLVTIYYLKKHLTVGAVISNLR